MPSVAVRRKAFPKFSPRLYADLKVGSTTEPRLQTKTPELVAPACVTDGDI
jgi:hypothetical protein